MATWSFRDRPARSRPPSSASDPVDQAAFERAVHVLVGEQRPEAAVGDVLAEAVQPGQQSVALLLGEQPGPEQHPRVGLRRGDVVGRQHPVEVGRLAQRGKRIRRPVGEPAAPQRRPRWCSPVPLIAPRSTFWRNLLALVAAQTRCVSAGGAVVTGRRSRWAAIFDDRPCTWTKPLALDWSNVSPSS